MRSQEASYLPFRADCSTGRGGCSESAPGTRQPYPPKAKLNRATAAPTIFRSREHSLNENEPQSLRFIPSNKSTAALALPLHHGCQKLILPLYCKTIPPTGKHQSKSQPPTIQGRRGIKHLICQETMRHLIPNICIQGAAQQILQFKQKILTKHLNRLRTLNESA